MAVSQNGWPANDRSLITSYVVSDSGRKMALRKGPAGEMLADFFRWFDREVRDIDPGVLDEWGYAERNVRGSDDVSNHASGTAGDVDATKWPLGVTAESYLTDEEIARIRARLRRYRGCIRWGGDYTGRKDPMHFEIDEDEATVARVWADIQQSDQEDDMPSAEEIATAVWNYDAGGEAGHQQARHLLSQARSSALRTEGRVAGLGVAVAELAKANNQPIDVAALLARIDAQVDRTVRDTLADSTVQVDVKVSGGSPG
jgi:hypothetical protein